MSVEITLAKRYAAAYLNLFDASLDLPICGRLEDIADFFKIHPTAMLVLKLSTVSSKDKYDSIKAVIDAFDVPDRLLRIVQLLLTQNRLVLFPKILNQISSLYKERHNITNYTVISSDALNDQAVKGIIDFLKRITGKHILHTSKVDKELIAGIRLQSDTNLWEYSINKQLRELQHQFNL